MSGFQVEMREGGLRFRVRVQPRASRNAIVGLHDGALKVALTAPPVEGKANAALVKLLAGVLGVARRQVRVVAGASSRDKTVEVDGVDADDLRRRLAR